MNRDIEEAGDILPMLPILDAIKGRRRARNGAIPPFSKKSD
jgi:hypothetical protein